MASLNMAFLKMIRGMKQYLGRQPGPPFALWARRITINQVVDDFRKNKKHLTVFESMEPMENGTLQLPDDSFFRKQNLEHLRAVIDSLPHMPKTIFNLYEVDGYRHDEIADMFGISVNTSKVHLHHARKKLREILRNENNVMYKPQNKIVHE